MSPFDPRSLLGEINHSPAPGEAPRVYLARMVFLLVMTPLTIIFLKLVPPTHPWRVLTESTMRSWKDATEFALRPRCRADVDEEE